MIYLLHLFPGTDAFQFSLPVLGVTWTGSSLLQKSPKFQFTLPAWGAIILWWLQTFFPKFQFLLPVWGAIILNCAEDLIHINFNSHFPRGERLDAIGGVINIITFQFTFPVWGAMVLAGFLVVLLVISILALAWGATCIAGRIVLLSYVFNSRSLCGERLIQSKKKDVSSQFQFSLPTCETIWVRNWWFYRIGFQFTLPAWGATASHII